MGVWSHVWLTNLYTRVKWLVQEGLSRADWLERVVGVTWTDQCMDGQVLTFPDSAKRHYWLHEP